VLSLDRLVSSDHGHVLLHKQYIPEIGGAQTSTHSVRPKKYYLSPEYGFLGTLQASYVLWRFSSAEQLAVVICKYYEYQIIKDY
jgi:hypothetical protein